MMTARRHKGAWIWLAMTAITVVSLARAQAGMPADAVYSHPVLQFLAAHQNGDAAAATERGRTLYLRSARRTAGPLTTGSAAGAWQAMLPVFFIGLIAPLSLITARDTSSLVRATASPLLPFRFQRPPPSFLS